MTVVVFLFVIDFNGLYGQDSYEYLRYSNALGDFIRYGKPPGDYFWPVGYPLSGAVFFWINNKAWILQSISLLSTVLCFYYLSLILNTIYQTEIKTRFLYLIFFFLLSPYVFRYSVLVMSDMLTVFFIVLAIYHYVQYFQQNYKWNLAALVFFSCCAIMTRYAAIVVLLPLLSHSGWLFMKKFNVNFFIILILAALLPCIPHLLIRTENSISFIHHVWFDTWSLTNLFKTDFNTSGGEYHYSVINLLYGFSSVIHPGFIFAGLLLVLYIRKEEFQNVLYKVLLSSVIVYAVFIAGISFQNPRFLLLSFPLILILLYPAAIRIIARFSRYVPIIIFAVIAIQLVLVALAFIPFYKYNRKDKEITAEIYKYSDISTIYTQGLEGPLRTYIVDKKVEGMSMDTIYNVNRPALVIINEKYLDENRYGAFQYNWEKISQYHPVKIDTINSEWSVYEIR